MSPYDKGLVARVADALLAIDERGTRQKNVFGGRGFLVGKSTFAIVFGDEMIVKSPREDYANVLATPGVRPFAPDGEKAMSTWVVVSPEGIAEDPELIEWLRRGLRAVR